MNRIILRGYLQYCPKILRDKKKSYIRYGKNNGHLQNYELVHIYNSNDPLYQSYMPKFLYFT
jgi:hypothetical protein